MADELTAHIHAATGTGVVVVTGGGSGAIARLLRAPGASRTILEARVPYAEAALSDFLGGVPDRACDPDTARAMAMAAFRRARELDPQAAFGVACTASLATDRAKRGPHRAHVALQTADATHVWSLDLGSGDRGRDGEEALTTELVLRAVAEAKAVPVADALPLGDEDRLEEERHAGVAHWRDVLLDVTRATAHHAPATPPSHPHPRLVFPGAFNPVHAGHLEMARVAADRTGLSPEFEICVRNVDKPPLTYADISRRVAGFPDNATIWLTAAPTFGEKADLFPGAVFMVGIDTLVRIADPRYYGGEPAARDAAIDHLAERGCRFLVFGRSDGERFVTLDDVELPPSLRALCEGVDETGFRRDLSSTSLRRR